MDLDIDSALSNVKKEDSSNDSHSTRVCVNEGASKDEDPLTEQLTNLPIRQENLSKVEGQIFTGIDKGLPSSSPLETEIMHVSNFQDDDDEDDVQFLEMRRKVNKIMKVDLCEDMRVSLENYYRKETDDLAKLHAGRLQKKIVLISDCRETVDTLQLPYKRISGLTYFNINKMNFKDSFGYIKKSLFFNTGAVFVFNCGAFSLVEPKCLPECQQFFCPVKNAVLDIRKPTPHLIEDAVNLHKEILSSTLNDTAIFCSLIPIDVKRHNEYFLNKRKCKTDHRGFRIPIISDETLSDYYEEINNFNKFAKHHALKLGFESWVIDNLWIDSLRDDGISLLNSKAIVKGQKLTNNFNALSSTLKTNGVLVKVEPRCFNDVAARKESMSIKDAAVEPTTMISPLSKDCQRCGKKKNYFSQNSDVIPTDCPQNVEEDFISFTKNTKNAINNLNNEHVEGSSQNSSNTAIKYVKCDSGELFSKVNTNTLTSKVSSQFQMNRTKLKNGQIFCELVRKTNLENNFSCKENSTNETIVKKRKRKKKRCQKLDAEVVHGFKKTFDHSLAKNVSKDTDLNVKRTQINQCTSRVLVDCLSKNVSKGSGLQVNAKEVNLEKNDVNVMSSKNYHYPQKMLVKSLTTAWPRKIKGNQKKGPGPKNTIKWKSTQCPPKRHSSSLTAKTISAIKMNSSNTQSFGSRLSAIKRRKMISETANIKGSKSSFDSTANKTLKKALDSQLMSSKSLRNFYEGGPELGIETYESFVNNLTKDNASQNGNRYLKVTSEGKNSSRISRIDGENKEVAVPLADNPKISLQNITRFDHFYFIGKKYLVYPFKRFGPKVTVIVHDLSHADESDVPHIIASIGRLQANSVCCLAFDLNVIAKTERVSENCVKFSCNSPIHIYSFNQSLPSNWKSIDCLNERLNAVRKIVFKFSTTMPTLLLPLRPSRVYCENKVDANTHLYIHSINRGSLYVVSGIKSSWKGRLKYFSVSWNAMVRENHENRSTNLPLEIFMHQYPSSLSCGSGPTDFADQWTDSKLWFSVGEIMVNSFLHLEQENRNCVEKISTSYDDEILKNVLSVPMKLRESSPRVKSKTNSSNFDEDLRDFITLQKKRKLTETSLESTKVIALDKRGSFSSVSSLGYGRDNAANDCDNFNAALKTILYPANTSSPLPSAISGSHVNKQRMCSSMQLPNVKETCKIIEIEKVNSETNAAEAIKYGEYRESSNSSKDAQIIIASASDPQEVNIEFTEEQTKLRLRLDDVFLLYSNIPELHPEYERYYYDYMNTQNTIFSDELKGYQDSSWEKYWESAINLIKKEERIKLNAEQSENSSQFINSLEDHSTETFNYASATTMLEATCKKIGILGSTLFSIIDYSKRYGIFGDKTRDALAGTAVISLLNAVSVKLLQLKSSAMDVNESRSLSLTILWTEKLKKLTDKDFQKYSNKIDLWAVVVSTVGKNSAFILAVIKAIVANEKLSLSEEEIQDILMKICSIHIQLEFKSKTYSANAVSLPQK